ncbi:MAG: hypothetical protein D6690_13005 [Nitrospirae bacterium]|nr:MAG: hypothetical protein D6690_13005 [Nitrospirota bacterium]
MNSVVLRSSFRWWKGAVAGCIVVVLLMMTVFTPYVGYAAEEESNKTEEALLGLSSGLLTLVYLPAKVVYAALGGIVGGVAFALTGGDLETAKSVWEPSFYGTYVITPSHLKGEEPVRFFGVSPYEDEGL